MPNPEARPQMIIPCPETWRMEMAISASNLLSRNQGVKDYGYVRLKPWATGTGP